MSEKQKNYVFYIGGTVIWTTIVTILHENHLPKDFSHSKVSVFVTQEGVAGGMTSECFSSALRCVSILALA